MWMAWPSTPSPSLLQLAFRNQPATHIFEGFSDTHCSTMRTMPTARYPGVLWFSGLGHP